MFLGFLIVAVISAYVGIMGIVDVNKVANQSVEMYENMTVPIELMGDISTNFHRMRSNLRDVIISPEKEEQKMFLSNIDEHLSSIKSLS